MSCCALTAPERALSALVDRCRPAMLWAVLVVWFVSVGTGLAWLMAYDNTPGTPPTRPRAGPLSSALARDAAGPTLVMLAHPRCDCTRASLGELAELLARAPQRPRTFVVFIRPGGVAAAGRRPARAIRRRGSPASPWFATTTATRRDRFGVWTSGQTLLYDRDGQLAVFGRHHRRARKVRRQHRTGDSLSHCSTAHADPRDHAGLRLLAVRLVERVQRRQREAPMVPELAGAVPTYSGASSSESRRLESGCRVSRAPAGALRADRSDVRLPDVRAVARGHRLRAGRVGRAPGRAPRARSTSTSGRR